MYEKVLLLTINEYTKKRDIKNRNGWFIKNLMGRKNYSFSAVDKRLPYLR